MLRNVAVKFAAVVGMPLASFGRTVGKVVDNSRMSEGAQALEGEIERREQVENDLRDALRNRSRVEEELRSSLTREKLARAQAEASDAFKEVFIGILGHDLRNPLNTVLTTTRLMIMRGELPAESQKRLERVVASGVRMERMIAQLLDLARVRLAGGIPISLGENEDVTARVSRVLVEIRAAHPAREVEFRPDSPCVGRVDGDRFEQVVSNLLDNAIAHGDPSKPIRVAVRERGDSVCLSVQNDGSVIPAELMPVLFDPFKRGQIAESERTGGLGLGLYIADRIVSAHGGSIDVESSVENGTRFDVCFPRHHE